jgi:hypothetical protein
VPYPVTFRAEYVEKRSRLTTFFRLVLAIPHIIFVYLYGLAAGVVIIIAWFALLFTGRYPQGMYDFVAGSLRYSTRVYGYLWLLTDQYPPFSGSADTPYPVDLNIGPPKSEYSRLKVLFRIILAIPVLIIHYAMQIVAELGAFIAWFAIVALGRQPRGLQDMIVLGTSYQQRAYAYLALITEDWPPFTDETTGRVEAAPAFGALPSTPPAAGPEHPTSVPPGGYASPEREAAFPSAPPAAPADEPAAAEPAAPAAPEAPASEPSVTVEPSESAAPEPPAPAPPAAAPEPAPPVAAPEPEPPAEPGPSAPTSGDPLGGGGTSAPTSGGPLGGGAAPPPPAPAPEPEPPTEPSPPSPGDWPDSEPPASSPPSPGDWPDPEPPASGPPSPGDWPDPEPVAPPADEEREPPPAPRADDEEDEPPPGPFGPSSTNP